MVMKCELNEIISICWSLQTLLYFILLRDDSQQKGDFMQNMIEDRTESALSYYEFLLHIQQQISK